MDKEIKKKLKKLFPHPKDIRYEEHKKLVDTLGMPLAPPYKVKDTTIVRPQDEHLFRDHRRGLLQFNSYMEADHWSLNFGACSFFIKGYKWPWHTRRDWRGLLFVTNAAVKKGEKF